MTPRPVLWRRTLHVLAGLIPLAYGVWRWASPLSIHSLLILVGLAYTLAVVLRRGRLVWGLAEFFQGAITLIFLDLALRHVHLTDLWDQLSALDLPMLLWGWVTWGAASWYSSARRASARPAPLPAWRSRSSPTCWR